MYAYPDRITDELLVGQCPKVLHYLDLPIQHCNAQLLRAMNRKGSRQELEEETVARIRSRLPGVVLRTTSSASPGRRRSSLRSCASLSRPYNSTAWAVLLFPEEGTPAARMEGQIAPAKSSAVEDIVMREQAAVAERLAESRVGEALTVLVEGYDASVKYLWPHLRRCPGG